MFLRVGLVASRLVAFVGPVVGVHSHVVGQGILVRLGTDSIEKFWIEFWLEKPLEFWLEVACTKKMFKNG